MTRLLRSDLFGFGAAVSIAVMPVVTPSLPQPNAGL
jgi:hypothetical protein